MATTLDQIRTRLNGVVDAVAGLDRLDAVGDPLQRAVERGLASTGAAPFLRGEWLGHPLHPALTDLPIGFWTSAWFLDFGGRRSRRAADAMVALGLLTVGPTALSGLADWAELDREKRRLGLVHMAANTTATLCYAASLAARMRKQRVRGVALSWAGAAAATAGAYLGGHLVFGGAESSSAAEAEGIVDPQGAVLEAGLVQAMDIDVAGPTGAAVNG